MDYRSVNVVSSKTLNEIYETCILDQVRKIVGTPIERKTFYFELFYYRSREEVSVSIFFDFNKPVSLNSLERVEITCRDKEIAICEAYKLTRSETTELLNSWKIPIPSTSMWIDLVKYTPDFSNKTII